MKTTSSIIAVLTLLSLTAAYADESLGEKAETKVDSAKTKVNRKVRKGKKKLRDGTGNSDRKEDLKDAAKNAGDSISDEANKLKRKVD